MHFRYAHLKNGSRILDVADLRQYIYEQMNRIRTNAPVMDGLYGNDNGHGLDITMEKRTHRNVSFRAQETDSRPEFAHPA